MSLNIDWANDPQKTTKLQSKIGISSTEAYTSPMKIHVYADRTGPSEVLTPSISIALVTCLGYPLCAVPSLQEQGGCIP